MDSRTHVGDLDITLPRGGTLIIAAGDWPDEDPDPASTATRRRLGRIDPSGPRPHVLGKLTVRTSGVAAPRPTLVLDGLAIEGSITIEPGSLGRLRLAHCTVLPDPTGEAAPDTLALDVQAGGGKTTRHPELEVEVVRCSLGPVKVTPFARAVHASESILRGHDAAIAALQAGDVHLDSVTLLGTAELRAIEASDSILLDRVQVSRRQQGCIRYSFVAPGSTVPRRYRCVPVEGAASPLPRFVSTRPLAPGYGQLSEHTDKAIAAGAENEDEMGAFRFVHAPHRIAHLDTRMAEYLGVGRETGMFFVT
jgi:hypothetical protein